jgi:hypothetical protein
VLRSLKGVYEASAVGAWLGLGRPEIQGRARDSRSQEVIRVIRRKTNSRHMIDDHHGRTTGRATLQVRAMDGILGTHTSSNTSGNLPSRSRIKNRARLPASWRSMTRFLGAWATQDSAG